MYGIMHVELQHFLETRYDHEAWRVILKRAGLEGRIYMPLSNYVDAEITAIIEAAADLKDVSAQTLFEDFGRFVIPPLMQTYAPLINPAWGMEDLLLNLDRTIYRVMRNGNPGIRPPTIRVERVDARTFHLYYNSPREMWALAKGFILGITAYYEETVDIQEKVLSEQSVAFVIRMKKNSNVLT